MFGIGFGEILVILLVALLVLGPEGLPRAARTVGRFFNDLRRTGDELKEELLFSDLDRPAHPAAPATPDAKPRSPLQGPSASAAQPDEQTVEVARGPRAGRP